MNWAVASFAVLAVALGLQIAAFERGRPSPRSLALVAALAGLAVAGRLAFAPLPNVKPTTDIVLVAGFALGASQGFAVGAVTALVSNMAFGQGPWTPWQMLAWGLVGVVGALLAKASGGRISRWGLAGVGALCGLMFGMIMDVSQWLTYGGEPQVEKLIAYSATSLPWNIAHAAGNVAFALAFGPMLIAAVRRAKQRLEPVWLPIGTRMNAVAVPAVFMALAVAPGSSDKGISAHSASASPVSWLLSAQNTDGGFGNDKGASSAPMTTAWAALGLAASGRRLDSTARSGGLTLLERLMVDAREGGDAGADERLLLAAVAGGADPSSFGGRNLVRDVQARISSGGAVKSDSGTPTANLTAFAILSLVGAGRDASSGRLATAVRWLAAQQQADGGFGPFAKGVGGSDVDDTAAAMQALAAAGRLNGSVKERALSFLRQAQSASGGFPLAPGQQPNAQSTAWAIQALIAAGDGSSAARSWLSARIAANGRVAYAPGSFQTPVWVTGQALVALSGEVLPLSAPQPVPGQRVPQVEEVVPNSVSGGLPSSSGETRVETAKRARSDSVAMAKEIRKGKAILHARQVAIAAARAAGTIVGAFVRAFGGPTR